MAWFGLRIGRARVSTRGWSYGRGQWRGGSSWRRRRGRSAGSADSSGVFVDSASLGPPIGNEDELRALRHQSDRRKDAALKNRLERAKGVLPADEVRNLSEMTDEEAEPLLAKDIAAMKRRNPAEWKLLLASLPKAERKMMQDIERRYRV